MRVGALCVGVVICVGGPFVEAGKEEGKKHGLGRTGGSWFGSSGQFVTASAIIGCAPGYTLSGERCERVEYAPGSLTCPKQGQLVGERCITRERVSPATLCPPGTRTVGDRCESTEILVPLVECPKGWEMAADGARCARIHKAKGLAACRDGWTRKHGECYREDIVPARPSCPTGHLLQNAGKHAECVLSETAAPEVFCPKGWVADGGACVHLKKKAKELESCPTGFASGHKGGCERRISQDPAVTCPPGSILQSGGKKGNTPMCLSLEHMPVVPSCKKGYQFSNNRCQKHGKGEVSIECPKGYELLPERGCFAQTEAEARALCPPGSEMRGKHCVTIEERPTSLQCAEGSSLVGGQCVSHEITAPRLVCPDGFRKSKKNGGTCEVEQIIVAEPNCPFDSHLSGKYCIMRQAAPADATCKKGELTPEGCVERLKKEPKHSCPKGFKKHKGSCAREVSLPGAFVCPEGAILQERNQCLATALSVPRFSCPQDFALDGNNNCLLDETIPAELGCPSNTVLTNGQCYHAAFATPDPKKKKHQH